MSTYTHTHVTCQFDQVETVLTGLKKLTIKEAIIDSASSYQDFKNKLSKTRMTGFLEKSLDQLINEADLPLLDDSDEEDVCEKRDGLTHEILNKELEEYMARF